VVFLSTVSLKLPVVSPQGFPWRWSGRIAPSLHYTCVRHQGGPAEVQSAAPVGSTALATGLVGAGIQVLNSYSTWSGQLVEHPVRCGEVDQPAVHHRLTLTGAADCTHGGGAGWRFAAKI
jgi:hypothetical protein